MVKIVHKELSYKIVGVLFEVHSELGNRYQEKYCQRAIEECFVEQEIAFRKELPVDILFKGEKIGKYYLDFLVDNKIVLEVKTVPKLTPKDFKQTLAYLIAHNLELGLLANFRSDKLIYKRILNSKFKSI